MICSRRLGRLAAAGLLALLCVPVAAAPAQGPPRVAESVGAGGVDLSGLTLDEAAAKLDTQLGPRLAQPIVVRSAGRRFTLPSADAKVKLYATKKGNHLTDFLSSVKSRQKPCTHEVIGSRSATVCNLMNLAYHHHASFGWDPQKFTFTKGGDAAWLRHAPRGDWKLMA